jgi:hypothetical protein
MNRRQEAAGAGEWQPAPGVAAPDGPEGTVGNEAARRRRRRAPSAA